MPRPGLRGVQQQVIAVHVHAIGGGAIAVGGAIGVGTGNHHHVDAIEQGFKQALCEFSGNHQQRFAARGFVPVLLADEHHRGTAIGLQAGHVHAFGARQEQAQNRFALLRGTQLQNTGLRGAPWRSISDVVQPLPQFGVGSETAPFGASPGVLYWVDGSANRAATAGP